MTIIENDVNRARQRLSAGPVSWHRAWPIPMSRDTHFREADASGPRPVRSVKVLWREVGREWVHYREHAVTYEGGQGRSGNLRFLKECPWQGRLGASAHIRVNVVRNKREIESVTSNSSVGSLITIGRPPGIDPDGLSVSNPGRGAVCYLRSAGAKPHSTRTAYAICEPRVKLRPVELLVAFVSDHSEPEKNLPLVAHANHATALFSCSRKRRQQQCCQDGDDGDDHEQLD
jgi:hypothetical protein